MGEIVRIAKTNFKKIQYVVFMLLEEIIIITCMWTF